MLTLIQKIAHLCLKPLIALFDFPIVPAELVTLVNKLFEYMQVGTGILNFFVPSLSARRAWIEIGLFSTDSVSCQVALRKESVDLSLIHISEPTRH